MREKSALSGSGLFLMELLIGLLIFALTAAICLEIFVGSHLISNEGNNMNHAVLRAQSGAECFKASNGDLRETAMLLKGYLPAGSDTVWKYFDSDWAPVYGITRNSEGKATNADFTLEIRRIYEQAGYISGEAVVRDISGNLIFSIPVAVLEVTP